LNCGTAKNYVVTAGYYQQPQDEYDNLIVILPEKKFELHVNLCVLGLGKIDGSWNILKDYLILTEEKRNFEGYQPGAPKEFKFKLLSESRFVYEGKGRFCFVDDSKENPNQIFTRIEKKEIRNRIGPPR
jgi:hypothetical protein